MVKKLENSYLRAYNFTHETRMGYVNGMRDIHAGSRFSGVFITNEELLYIYQASCIVFCCII